MDKNILRNYLNKFNVSELRTLVRYFDKQFAGASCKAGSSCKNAVTEIKEWFKQNTSNHYKTISHIQNDTKSTDKKQLIMQLYIDTVHSFCRHHEYREYREYEMESEMEPCPGVIDECKTYIDANADGILKGTLTNEAVTNEIIKIIIKNVSNESNESNESKSQDRSQIP